MFRQFTLLVCAVSALKVHLLEDEEAYETLLKDITACYNTWAETNFVDNDEWNTCKYDAMDDYCGVADDLNEDDADDIRADCDVNTHMLDRAFWSKVIGKEDF